MNVNPGEFRHRIKFVKTEEGTNSNGFPISEETEICQCQAKISNLSGTEKIKSGAEIFDVNTRFLIRYNSLINEDMEIVFNNNYYDIQFINDYEFKHEYMEVWAILNKKV